MIRGEKLFLEYEGLHAICFRCGKYGHKKDHCVEFLGNPPSDVQRQTPAEAPTEHGDSIMDEGQTTKEATPITTDVCESRIELWTWESTKEGPEEAKPQA